MSSITTTRVYNLRLKKKVYKMFGAIKKADFHFWMYSFTVKMIPQSDIAFTENQRTPTGTFITHQVILKHTKCQWLIVKLPELCFYVTNSLFQRNWIS